MIAEERVKAAMINLSDAIARMDAGGVDYSVVPMTTDQMYALSAYCQDLGEQVLKLLGFYYNDRYRPKNAVVAYCTDVLVELRNKISHELSVWVSPQQLYLTAAHIVESEVYMDSIDILLAELHAEEPEIFAYREMSVPRIPHRRIGNRLGLRYSGDR